MNIFFTDRSPQISARNLCDKHVNKMLIETTQILSTALYLERRALYDTYADVLDKPAWIHSPLVAWAKISANFVWLAEHMDEIALQLRFVSTKPLEARKDYLKICTLRTIGASLRAVTYERGESITPPFLALGGWKNFIVNNLNAEALRLGRERDPIEFCAAAYRRFYALDKWPFAKWTRGREQPVWFAATLAQQRSALRARA